MSKKSTDPIVRLLAILCPVVYFASYLTRKNYGIVMEAVIASEGVTNAQAGLVETLALILSFIPGAHYASCPLLVVAMAPWIIPDLRMKRVFEEARRREE